MEPEDNAMITAYIMLFYAPPSKFEPESNVLTTPSKVVEAMRRELEPPESTDAWGFKSSYITG